MRTFLRLLLLVSVGVSGFWWFKEGGFEPAVTILGAFATLIGDYISNGDFLMARSKAVFKQRGGKKSKLYQAAGDINTYKSKK